VLCECDENDMSWLYLPGKETDAHRIIYTGNFSETNNEGSKRRTCVVEFSGNVDNETMFGQLNRLPGNLKPLATNYQENSYIIHDTSTKALIENLKTELEPHGISLLGRFAEWEYFNMDACIESSMKLSTRLKTNKLK
jgi:UDP-galactopyranose mutase